MKWIDRKKHDTTSESFVGMAMFYYAISAIMYLVIVSILGK